MTRPYSIDEASDTTQVKQLVEAIVRRLVDEPRDVKVAVDIGAGGSTIIMTVRVGAGDAGKAIGKGGRNATALRTLLEAMYARTGVRAMLHVDDNRPDQRRNIDQRGGRANADGGRKPV